MYSHSFRAFAPVAPVSASSYTTRVAEALHASSLDFTQDQLSNLSPQFLRQESLRISHFAENPIFILRHAPAPQLIDALEGEMISTLHTVQRGAVVWHVYASRDCDEDVRQILAMTDRVFAFAGRSYETTTLALTVFLVHNPKRYEGGSPGSARYINSASTADSRNVIVFRSEEAVKVIAHELMHVFRHDRFNLSERLRRALTAIDVVGASQPYEAVAEVMAQCVMSEFVADRDGVPFVEVLSKQVEHGALQSAKFLAWNGVLSLDRRPRIVQTTYATEYYVYRSAFMMKALSDPDLLTIVKAGTDDQVFVAFVAAVNQSLLPGAPFRSALETCMRDDEAMRDPSMKMNFY